MTVAISCNLSDGVILGVDSGLAGFGERSMGSFLREFEQSNPNGVLTAKNDLASVVESLRQFLYDKYQAIVVPALQAAGQDFEALLQGGRAPTSGLVIGGYSSGEYLPELWNVIIPYHSAAGSGQQRVQRGGIGVTWYSMFEPIVRYINGMDPQIFAELKPYVTGLLAREFTAEEETQIGEIIGKYQYKVSFDSMPIDQGIKYVRFLVDLAIRHYHFSSGFSHAPFTEKIVGGKVRLGVVTYKGGKFKILDEVES